MTNPGDRRVLAIRRTAPDGASLIAFDVLAREAGMHPELARRLIALGALEPRDGGATRAPLFPRDAAARLARIVRLRRDLGLSYAEAMLACDLLDERHRELCARLATTSHVEPREVAPR